MYNDETYWFSQHLFGYKDKSDGSDAYLSVSATTSSKDLLVLGHVFISLRISNHISKSCLLKIQDLMDLNSAFQKALKQDISELFDNSNDNPVIRRYQKNQDLIFEFKTNSNNEYVVKMTIRNSSTDFAMVIFPVNYLKVLIQIFSNFRDNHAQFITMLEQKMVVRKLDTLKRIEHAIKGLYTQNTVQDNIQDNGAPEPEASWAVGMMQDLDKFLGEDMKNIEVPEEIKQGVKEIIEHKPEKPPQEINSDLMKYLKYDLHNIEVEIMNRSNIMEFVDEMNKNLGFDVLPNISGEELNSLIYISTLFYHITLNGYTVKGSPIPSSFPILQYNPKSANGSNLELALDLLMIHGYFRFLRRRLENHIVEPRENYAIFNLALRSFSDPLVYGHLADKDITQITTQILNRFKYYKYEGVFKYYDELVEKNRAAEIVSQDIETFVGEVFSVLKDKPYIIEFHDYAKDQNNLRLETNNSLDLEQIINEVVPTEVQEKLGNEINKEALSDEVKKIFDKELKSKPKKRQPQKNQQKFNPLQMFIKKMRVELEDDVQTILMGFAGDYTARKVDFSQLPFDVKDLPEDVLKGLYYWDPEKHKNMTQLMQVLDEPLEKDLIIAKIESSTENTDSSQEWSDAMKFI